MVIDDNKFAVILTPKEDSKGWTGDVDITIKYSENNTMAEADINAILNLATLMTASVNLMETDSSFLDIVHDHRAKLEVEDTLSVIDILEDDVSDSPNVISKEGNVIKLNWTRQ